MASTHKFNIITPPEVWDEYMTHLTGKGKEQRKSEFDIMYARWDERLKSGLVNPSPGLVSTGKS